MYVFSVPVCVCVVMCKYIGRVVYITHAHIDTLNLLHTQTPKFVKNLPSLGFIHHFRVSLYSLYILTRTHAHSITLQHSSPFGQIYVTFLVNLVCP